MQYSKNNYRVLLSATSVENFDRRETTDKIPRRSSKLRAIPLAFR